MKIIQIKRANGKEVKTLDLGDFSFDKAASIICSAFNTNFKNKLSGPDQTYWDIEINNVLFTLHYEHYLGVTFYPAEGNTNPTLIDAVLAIAKKSFTEIT